MHTLHNDLLKIAVKNTGAELCEISSVKHHTQFMWDANPKVWAGYSPNLFPIIGALKHDKYIFENQEYSLPKHGFIRHNRDVRLHKKTGNNLTFVYSANENSLKHYPFKFEFYISYTLKDHTLEVDHVVKNCDDKTMFFSVGGHPAFKCPVYKNEAYEDYSLDFEQVENSRTHLVNTENGLIKLATKPLFDNSKSIALTHNLFNEDALIFKDLKSKKVTLTSQSHGPIVSVDYTDFPYLGIWAKPEGDYVCIEPWLGIADHEDGNQDFKTKEGIISLEAGKTFEAAYAIEIHKSHLV